VNAGKVYEKAKRKAQVNADATGRAWCLFEYNGVYWIEQVNEDRPVKNAEILQPKGKQK